MDRYAPRPIDALSPMARLLAADGIARTADIYSPQTIRDINAVVDPLLAAQQDAARAYVTVEDMARVGLFGMLLGGAMRDCLLSVMPDPVLYHCHIFEIAARGTKSHVFSDRLSGAATGTMGIADTRLARAQAGAFARRAQGWVERRLGRQPAQTAAHEGSPYDTSKTAR
jgi:hypothetical protein